MNITFSFKVIIIFIFVLLPLSAQSQEISVDNVSGTWNDGGITKIIPNNTVSFDIRLNNNSGGKIKGLTNGFKIWTTGGSPFSPIIGEYDPAFAANYDLIFGVAYFSADGIGADTVGFGGSILGTGTANGYSEVVYEITTGNIQAGETLCIDSASYPQGEWKWVTSIIGDTYPSWSGPHCYIAECPGTLPPTFTNCIDTIHYRGFNWRYTQSTVMHKFKVEPGFLFPSQFFIVDGPGTIDSVTGVWSYSIPSEELDTFDTLVIGTYDISKNCTYSSCYSILDFTNRVLVDLNDDGIFDISDIVYMVDLMFYQGPLAVPPYASDLNYDQLTDISDLVMLVDLIPYE